MRRCTHRVTWSSTAGLIRADARHRPAFDSALLLEPARKKRRINLWKCRNSCLRQTYGDVGWGPPTVALIGLGAASRRGRLLHFHQTPMTGKRNRTKQLQPLQQRLRAWAESAREHARHMPPGKDREMLLRRAKQSEVTSSLTEWLTTPSMQRHWERGGS